MARRAPVFDAIAGLAHEMPLIGAMAMRNFTDILALLKKGRQLNATDEARIRPTVLGICDMIGPLPDQPCLHLDRGYDSTKTRDLLEILGYDADIATKGVPAPIQAGKRWPVERTHSWMNGYGKLRRCTDKRKIIIEFYLYLAAALTVIRRLINRARTLYSWPTRPTTRRLR